MSRNAALIAAAEIIARSVPDLARLVELLDMAGMPRLAAALRDQRPAEVRGLPRPDPEMWRTGRIR